jgi:hypothetical protein
MGSCDANTTSVWIQRNFLGSKIFLGIFPMIRPRTRGNRPRPMATALGHQAYVERTAGFERPLSPALSETASHCFRDEIGSIEVGSAGQGRLESSSPNASQWKMHDMANSWRKSSPDSYPERLINSRTISTGILRPRSSIKVEGSIPESPPLIDVDERTRCPTGDCIKPMGSNPDSWGHTSCPTPPESVLGLDHEAGRSPALEMACLHSKFVSKGAGADTPEDEKRIPELSTDRQAGGTQGKRSQQAAFAGSNDTDSGLDIPPFKRQRSEEDADVQSLSLACPFYKKNVRQYQACLGFHLRRIKDVKQHIYRKHSHPDYYCSRCFTVFGNATLRDQHTRHAGCLIKPDQQFDGITDQQKKSLKQYVSRSKCVEEQWFETWDIIFPGCHRPASVYVGNYMEEAMPLFRAAWDGWRESITSGVAQMSQFRGVDKRVLCAAMESVFNRFARVITTTNLDLKSSVSAESAEESIDTSNWERVAGAASLGFYCAHDQNDSTARVDGNDSQLGMSPASTSQSILMPATVDPDKTSIGGDLKLFDSFEDFDQLVWPPAFAADDDWRLM